MRLCLSSSSCGLYCRMTVAPLRPCELGRLRRSTHAHAREKGETSAGPEKRSPTLASRDAARTQRVLTIMRSKIFVLYNCNVSFQGLQLLFTQNLNPSYFMDPPLQVTKSQVNVHESDRKHAQLRSNIGRRWTHRTTVRTRTISQSSQSGTTAAEGTCGRSAHGAVTTLALFFAGGPPEPNGRGAASGQSQRKLSGEPHAHILRQWSPSAQLVPLDTLQQPAKLVGAEAFGHPRQTKERKPDKQGEAVPARAAAPSRGRQPAARKPRRPRAAWDRSIVRPRRALWPLQYGRYSTVDSDGRPRTRAMAARAMAVTVHGMMG